MADRLPPFRTFLASDNDIRELLRDSRTVAVIGLGEREPGIGIARFLRQRGYRVLPVAAAGAASVLGVEAAADLDSVPERVDIAVVLQPDADVPELARAAAVKGARSLWLERGVVQPEGAFLAAELGLKVAMNRSIVAEYEMHFPVDEVGEP